VGIEAIRRYHDWISREDVPYDFEISRFEITNALWRDFIEDQEEELAREERDLGRKGLLDEAIPGLDGGWVLDQTGRYAPPADALDLPVRNVSARAAYRFGRYLEARLDEPGVRIRVPTAREWEYAARGKGWQAYPWGRAFELPSEPGTGGAKPLYGIYDRHPLPVDSVDPDDKSPRGVVGMGTNVGEITERWRRRTETDSKEETLEGTELRGASFGDSVRQARRWAKVWESREVDPTTKFPYVGVRLVKVYSVYSPK
jgi:formylglycine-generating enzyme required for sulfatase activity